jgi:hypothetical protein
MGDESSKLPIITLAALMAGGLVFVAEPASADQPPEASVPQRAAKVREAFESRLQLPESSAEDATDANTQAPRSSQGQTEGDDRVADWNNWDAWNDWDNWNLWDTFSQFSDW